MSSQRDTPAEREKGDISHVEGVSHHGSNDPIGFQTDEDHLPPGYYRSPFFIGTLAAISIGFAAGVGGFGLIAPILLVVNADIGPDPNLTWVSLSYLLTTAVCITIIGRVSDIFGRRWVFIGGTALGLIGSIICATAHHIPTLTGGTAIIGIGAASQLSYYYVFGELVPMKYRFVANAVVYVIGIPATAAGPIISNSFLIYHPSVGWRGNYYLLIALNAIALICWVLFYHPPSFHMKHENESVWKYIKNFDYGGTVLYTGGLLIFLMGLNWGGAAYAWNSVHVIATIVIGFVTLVCFVLYECFMQLKEPLVPMKLFLYTPWVASVILSSLGQSIYYAFAIVWPQTVALLYSDDSSPIGAAWIASVSGISWTTGILIGGFVATAFGRIKYQCSAAIFLGGLFFGLVATCSPDTRSRACAFVAVGSFFIAWMESLAIAAITLTTPNQSELGSAGGIGGSIRFLITSISTTVYNVILSNRQAKEIPATVPAALVSAGLPESSIVSFIKALALGPASLAKVPGISPEITAAGLRAYKIANANSFRTVFFATIAFSSVALIASLFLPNFDNLVTKQVATTLGKEKIAESKMHASDDARAESV